MIQISVKSGLITGAILLVSAQFGLALDADRFADQLTTSLSNSGTDLTYGDLSINGTDVIVSDSYVSLEGEKLPIGTILFKNVTEKENGDFLVEMTSFENIAIDEDDLSLSLRDIKIENLRLSRTPDEDGLSHFALYDRFSTGPFTLGFDNQDIFSFTGSELIVDISSETTMSMTGEIAGMILDLSSLPDPTAQRTVRDMGYEVLNGRLELAAAWDAERGNLSIPLYELSIEDVGSLNFAMELGGYTLDLAKDIQELQNQMAEQSDNAQAQKAAGMALMGMVQQLTLISSNIEFEDQSVTEKMLEYFGAQQGLSGEQTAQMAKGFLPFLLGRMGIPDLEAQIMAAASTYLDDPQNLTVSAEPEAPLSFGEIMGAAMSDPKSIVDLINLDIQANQ